LKKTESQRKIKEQIKKLIHKFKTTFKKHNVYDSFSLYKPLQLFQPAKSEHFLPVFSALLYKLDKLKA
jgi:hypothetical protein